jgi:hypothetical protein
MWLAWRGYLFRGQNRPWCLRKSIHRANRVDLMRLRFLNEDIQVLHKHLSARTKHVFNLLQLHGYPTLLFGWTYSPYVAEFFAYRSISNYEAAEAVPADKIKSNIFDQAQWKADWSQLHILVTAGPLL